MFRTTIILLATFLPSFAMASTTDELAKSSWSFALFVAGSMLAVGYLIDQMFGWIWSDKIGKSLLQRSNKYFDLHFVPTIHNDLQIAEDRLNRVFGEKLISKKFFFVSFITLFACSLLGIWVESVSREVPIALIGIIAGLVMSVFAALSNITSLAATHWLLRRATASIIGLSLVLTLDALVAYLTMGLPWWLGGSLLLWEKGVSFTEWFFITFSKYIFTWPVNIWHGFIAHDDFTFQAWFNLFGVGLMCFGAVLPSLFHGQLVIRDVFRLAILRWFYLGIAGLFSNLAASKHPITVILGGVGACIPLAQLLADGLPWLRYVLSTGT